MSTNVINFYFDYFILFPLKISIFLNIFDIFFYLDFFKNFFNGTLMFALLNSFLTTVMIFAQLLIFNIINIFDKHFYFRPKMDFWTSF